MVLDAPRSDERYRIIVSQRSRNSEIRLRERSSMDEGVHLDLADHRAITHTITIVPSVAVEDHAQIVNFLDARAHAAMDPALALITRSQWVRIYGFTGALEVTLRGISALVMQVMEVDTPYAIGPGKMERLGRSLSTLPTITEAAEAVTINWTIAAYGELLRPTSCAFFRSSLPDLRTEEQWEDHLQEQVVVFSTYPAGAIS